MMELEVIYPFYDTKELGVLRTPGSIVNCDEERAKELVARGLGKYIPKPVVEVEEKEEAAPVAEALFPAEDTGETEDTAPKKKGRAPKAKLDE